ncbi:hypothetical protein DLNHIDIE_01897 [Acidithiobacillus thiooxidans ATCC 19377]|uniref:Uncharacterized protein n=1 Tax=Acidithiobacillus thiooxidans ATCC 19377 TaxID=637390 RepID=A0A543Q6R4_ACITH|nr:hypothetical protein DLNHIDIE_01897 [Acidithiobacillus thiooxidans ATCC 19377]
MALVGTRLATEYIGGKDTMVQEILLLIVFAEWVGLEYVGYLIVGKGGVLMSFTIIESVLAGIVFIVLVYLLISLRKS